MPNVTVAEGGAGVHAFVGASSLFRVGTLLPGLGDSEWYVASPDQEIDALELRRSDVLVGIRRVKDRKVAGIASGDIFWVEDALGRDRERG